ncbi:MAG: cysteine protease [Prevotella sp.]
MNNFIAKLLMGKCILFAGMAVVVIAAGCSEEKKERGKAADGRFSIEVMNRFTPVKDQGRSTLCWAYAMLSAIETEHIMRGDSVNLSVNYVVRNVLLDNCCRCYLSRGKMRFTMRGMGHTLINSIGRDGLVAYDAYRGRGDADTRTLTKKVARIAQKAITTEAGLGHLMPQADRLITETLGTPPRRVYMLGATYTPQEFARSVCSPGEYVALTSFTHHPFGENCVLEVPDNYEQNSFLNVPIDTLLAIVERAVRHHRGICWEGDTSNAGFSFARGTAQLLPSESSTQLARQRAFERFETTDDHCMAVVGLARDSRGGLFFIMKNSWGTANPYGGLMYVSADYVRKNTVAVYLPRDEVFPTR